MYEYYAKVLEVHDGDTVTVDIDLGFNTHATPIHIRLKGIDAPELKTPEGVVARDWLKGYLDAGNEVDDGWVIVQTTRVPMVKGDEPDKYGERWLGVLYDVRSANTNSFEFSINNLMITTGHARPYDGGKR
jgi:endonuclease YncB( thermonuclease family)